ncbi:MAG: (2Fe-2S)-binding protein, partial [Synergistaceae bacterium]|nr:(2Fe-2S)-binding protein [Synergistaceae bacterium]
MELIQKHPILDFRHGKEVTFTFDGSNMKGFEGEPIAMA